MDSNTENLHARSEPTTICQLSTFNVFHETFLCLGKSKKSALYFFLESRQIAFSDNGAAPLEEAGRLAAGGRAGGRLGGREEEAPGGVPGGAWPAFPPVLAGAAAAADAPRRPLGPHGTSARSPSRPQTPAAGPRGPEPGQTRTWSASTGASSARSPREQSCTCLRSGSPPATATAGRAWSWRSRRYP